MANPKQLGLIRESAVDWNKWRQQNPKAEVNLTQARLRGRKLVGANLNAGDLSGAILAGANLSRANLSKADLRRANLSFADLTGADLSDADLRSANLQYAYLDRSTTHGIRLWESQRAGWTVREIRCERAFWDTDGKVATSYPPGEFEKLHSDRTFIELLYPGGILPFELNTLPALMHHLASLHPGSNLRLKSIEEIASSDGPGRSAKISLSVGGGDQDMLERLRAEAQLVYSAQLALREKEAERLKIEKDYAEELFRKLIPALIGAAPRNVFNAPVGNLVQANDNALVQVAISTNDLHAMTELLWPILNRLAELELPTRKTEELESEITQTLQELKESRPDPSVLSKGLGLIKRLVAEGLKAAANKLGEAAVTDWQSWLNQLTQLVHHLR